MAKFQIKVVLLGNASAGKTMVLHALFKDNYPEVSIGRATSSINYFRTKTYRKSGPVYPARKSSKGPYDAATHRSTSVLKESSDPKLSLPTPPRIDEKYFDVQLEEPLFGMRRNTELVFCSVPGVYEAGTSNIYHQYVTENWDTFDCVVLVMDVTNCGDKHTQLSLLDFVKNMQEKRATPLIVLCNKVDDPDDAEIQMRVDKMLQEVSRVFAGRQYTPSFIPISACKAFVYRAASHLSVKDFKQLDKEHIDWIGKEECGVYKWKGMSEKAQYKAVRDVGQDATQYDMRLKACNFNAFLQSLENILGSEELQQVILTKQLEVAASKVSFSADFGHQLCQVFEKSIPLGKAVDDINAQFWKLWGEANGDAFKKFRNDPAAYRKVHRLFDQLVCWSESPAAESSKIAGAMKDLVREKCAVIVNNAPHICSTDADAAMTPWSKLSVFQFRTIIDSICTNFLSLTGRKIFRSQYATLRAAEQWVSCSPSATIRGEWNAFMGDIQEMVPASVSDPNDWGYLEWKVCEFLEDYDMDASVASEDNGDASVGMRT